MQKSFRRIEGCYIHEHALEHVYMHACYTHEHAIESVYAGVEDIIYIHESQRERERERKMVAVYLGTHTLESYRGMHAHTNTQLRGRQIKAFPLQMTWNMPINK